MTKRTFQLISHPSSLISPPLLGGEGGDGRPLVSTEGEHRQAVGVVDSRLRVGVVGPSVAHADGELHLG